MAAEDIQAQISQMQAQIAGCRAKLAKLQEQMERLQEVKPEISKIKTNLEEEEIDLYFQTANQEKWRGKRKDIYNEAVYEQILLSYVKYYGGVDDILESIDAAISRIDSEIRELQARMASMGNATSLLLNGLNNALK